MRKIVFLDFDGVLHPEDVRLIQGRIVLMPDGHNLFEHADLLAEHLAPRDDIDIVLSTTWVMRKSFDFAKSRLPEALQRKVIGATYHSSMASDAWGISGYGWLNQTRYQQIGRYVRRHRVEEWLALDDDDSGWPDAMRHRLVKCDEWGGIGEALDDFLTKLEML